MSGWQRHRVTSWSPARPKALCLGTTQSDVAEIAAVTLGDSTKTKLAPETRLRNWLMYQIARELGLRRLEMLALLLMVSPTLA